MRTNERGGPVVSREPSSRTRRRPGSPISSTCSTGPSASADPTSDLRQQPFLSSSTASAQTSATSTCSDGRCRIIGCRRRGHDMKRRTRVAAGAVVVLVVVLAAGGFAFWQLFGGSDPSPVALNPVTSSVAPTATASSGGTLDGTWTIDDTSGSLAEGTSSFAGYRVKEELAGTGANTAVGRTQNVSGSLTIDGATITAMQVSVDMTTLQSDDSRRDERLRTDGLQTDQFPTATFTLTKPIEVGSVPKDGQTIQAVAVGNLTLHGVTRSVEVSIQAQRNGNEIEAIGSVDVVLTDYAIEAPTGFLVLSIANTGTIELHLLFQPA